MYCFFLKKGTRESPFSVRSKYLAATIEDGINTQTANLLNCVTIKCAHRNTLD